MTNKPNDRDARERPQQSPNDEAVPRYRSGYQRQTIAEAAIKSFIRSIAGSLGRVIMRSITGRIR